MKRYYEVLGVREGATKDEIRRAYKELVKKYHPDQYRNNPLSELAQEKMKEINEAYEHLMKNGTSDQKDYRYTGSSSSAGDGFQQVRAYIQTGNLHAAEDLLARLNANHAEWHYLNGVIALKKGWYNNAYHSFQNAINMDPHNPEYRRTWQDIQGTAQGYRTMSYRKGGGSPSACDICTCLICSDCCCECAGGDLIACC